MANYLEAGMKAAIEKLRQQGLSIRKIASTLGLNRRTVTKYSRDIPRPLNDSKCTTPSAKVPTGTKQTKTIVMEHFIFNLLSNHD